MQKRTKRALSLILAFLGIFLLTACGGTASEAERISKRIDLSVDGGNVEIFTDSHGGFLGDGETYAKVTFSDETFCDKIKQSSKWSALPLTEALNIVVYGGEMKNGYSRDSFIVDEEDRLLIPTINNGYYFFKDRHSESKDSKDDTSLFERNSLNFTLAIYDIDSKTLYFYEIDT